MSRQGSVPTSNFGTALHRAATSSTQRDIPAKNLRAEIFAVYDARTLEESPLSPEDKNQIAERLGLKLSAVTDELLKKSLWAKVKIYGHDSSRMVPIQLSSKDLAEHGNGANIVELGEGELDALIRFQGKGFKNGTLVQFISKNSTEVSQGKGSEQTQRGFVDLMSSTRVFDIAGV